MTCDLRMHICIMMYYVRVYVYIITYDVGVYIYITITYGVRIYVYVIIRDVEVHEYVMFFIYMYICILNYFARTLPLYFNMLYYKVMLTKLIIRREIYC